MARYIKQDATTVPQINTELEKIEVAIQDTLSRKGDTPNAMTAPLDMNGERVLNLPAPVADTDPLRKIDGEVYVTAAAVSAAEALASEQAAAVSAQEAAVSESVAISAAEVSEGLFDELNTLYLGSFTTGPETDNQGDPLVQGVLYYNTVQKVLFVFNGSIWVEAASQQAANNAAISAQEAADSASAALASQQAAATSETNAAASASQAFVSASAADGSAADALLSEQAADAAASAAEDARDEAVAYASAFSKGLIFIGVYDASTGVFPTLPDPLIGNPFWIINVTGTISGTVYDQGDTLIYDSTTEVWIKLDTTDRVVSVAGKVGAVTLDKADVGLSNVDNTSDLNKPISTATQTALDGKANTAHTHVISDVTGLQSALDAKVDDSQLATAATANSVAQRTGDGSINAVNVYASGKIGVGSTSPIGKLDVSDGTNPLSFDSATYNEIQSYNRPLLLNRQGQNIGIGTTSPSNLLDIKKDSPAITQSSSSAAYYTVIGTNVDFLESFSIDNKGSKIITYGDDTSKGLGLSGGAGNLIRFTTNSAERLRIDSSGNVGIGVSNPSMALDVAGACTSGGQNGANVLQTLYDTTAWAAGVGGGVGFAGNAGSTISDVTFSTINGIKENATDDNFAGALTFKTRPNADVITERMRIDSSGNVGIGTSSPSRNLEVSTAVTGAFKINGTSNGGFIQFSSSGTDNYIGMPASVLGGNATDMAFYTNTTERMRIDSSGNVLVGGASAIAVGIPTLQLGGSDGNGLITVRRNTTETAGAIGFYNPNGNVGNILLDGSSTTYATSSDYRLKEDWQPMEGSIDRLMQLKPCNFAWKVDGSRVDGFLAHEAQEVVPEAVHGTKDAMRTEQYEVSPAVYEDVVIPAKFDEEGNEISPERTEQRLVSEAVMGERELPQYQGIDQSKLTPLLTAALQDAVKMIHELQNEIKAIKAQLND
jgi:hypothetical protein